MKKNCHEQFYNSQTKEVACHEKCNCSFQTVNLFLKNVNTASHWYDEKSLTLKYKIPRTMHGNKTSNIHDLSLFIQMETKLLIDTWFRSEK